MMLTDIAELRTFVRVFEAGSLSAAGRELGVALSVVSKRLASLERRCKTQLITRSTRRLAATDEGRQFYDRARRILAEVDEAEAALKHERDDARGVLRISAPIALGRAHVSVVCRKLADNHPRLTFDLVLTDRVLDLIDERIDVAIRIGMPSDSSFKMRKLAENQRVLVASRAYLKRRGRPAAPEDLIHHDCLSYGRTLWRLARTGPERREVKIAPLLDCNSGEVAHDWALAGYGIMFKSLVDVAPDLAAGRLVRVLDDWASDPAPVCALYPASSHVPTRVGLFLDAMTQRLRGASRI